MDLHRVSRPKLHKNRSLISHHGDERSVQGRFVQFDGQKFFQIANSHLMEPFFCSLVSASNHWMFVSSDTALTAGRVSSSKSLFPYYSADKLLDLGESAGTKTIVRINSDRGSSTWEPFSVHSEVKDVVRNVYKSEFGTKILFEEINQAEGICFRFSWSMSKEFGFVRTCWLENQTNREVEISLLDGLQNVLPGGVDPDFQMRFSNLGEAYRKCELLESQLGLYYLSSVPTDRAEPSEGTLATVVWSENVPGDSQVLLGDDDIVAFRQGKSCESRKVLRGKRASYLVSTRFILSGNETQSWVQVADLEFDQTDIVALIERRESSSRIWDEVHSDVQRNEDAVRRIVSRADGVQSTGRDLVAARHCSNVIFNVLRGGTPLDGYRIPTSDLRSHLRTQSIRLSKEFDQQIRELGETVTIAELSQFAQSTGDFGLERVIREYLPFTYSRRHGDPSRPWNHFSINVEQPNGDPNLDYEGNWRDIFQNWEALGYSYPSYLPGMLARFVNASTADGYNPYRVYKSGFEWEVPEPDDPWSNIGYWGDHQIIYQLKLIEAARQFDPNSLGSLLRKPAFVYANVPYRIAGYEAIKSNPQSTITFDTEVENLIQARVEQNGAIGKLLQSDSGQIVHCSLMEKLLVSGLVKIANLVPEAGIWLNTQRPEWNDANNALVGNGCSVVTAAYLYRYFRYLKLWLQNEETGFEVSAEVADFLRSISSAFQRSSDSELDDNSGRLHLVNELQAAGEAYREKVYAAGFAVEKQNLSVDEVVQFFDKCCANLEKTLRHNVRTDGLYDGYNLIRFEEHGITIGKLPLMLEGQVAILSAGILSPSEVIQVLESLRKSELYCQRRKSYLLQPDKQLGEFLSKNILPGDSVESSPLLQEILKSDATSIIRKDAQGNYRFKGGFRNAEELRDALNDLANSDPDKFGPLVDAELESTCELMRSVFDHHEYMGRSGTFFGYEGLGSIYWHMVSKLALAAAENYADCCGQIPAAQSEKLLELYRDVRSGLGMEINPADYGAFPTDPYSHTPSQRGAQQPGMTGQVKEDILCRWLELGLRVEDGAIRIEPSMLDESEYHENESIFSFESHGGGQEQIKLEEGQLAFTFCQTPVVYSKGLSGIRVTYSDGSTNQSEHLSLSLDDSSRIIQRTGEIIRVDVGTANAS